MNELAVILLTLILATMLLGRGLMMLIVAALFFGTFVTVAGAVLIDVTNGAIKDWLQNAFVLVFVAGYGFLFSYLIWSGLKSIWNRLAGSGSEQSTE